VIHAAAQVKPIFLFSLPRSGSTLTQRVLGAHASVTTASEPWILLPLIYAIKPEGTYAEYEHRKSHIGITEFLEGLPGAGQEYLGEVKALVLRLYDRAADDGSKYFLDKTPRYHLVAEEITRLFPEAHFVFLWRNPLAIVASMIDTWGRGRWNIYEFTVDLYKGLDNLVTVYKERRARSIAFRYEDFVVSEQATSKKLFRYLELQFDPSVMSRFADVELKGRMGDHAGVAAYQGLSREPLEKWKTTLASPLRKRWCRRYLHWIGRDRLAVMGYDLDELLGELDSIPTRYATLLSDSLRMTAGPLLRIFEPWMLRDKLARRSPGEQLLMHR
jgi:hypothetical protein